MLAPNKLNETTNVQGGCKNKLKDLIVEKEAEEKKKQDRGGQERTHVDPGWRSSQVREDEALAPGEVGEHPLQVGLPFFIVLADPPHGAVHRLLLLLLLVVVVVVV